MGNMATRVRGLAAALWYDKKGHLTMDILVYKIFSKVFEYSFYTIQYILGSKHANNRNASKALLFNA